MSRHSELEERVSRLEAGTTEFACRVGMLAGGVDQLVERVERVMRVLGFDPDEGMP